jgi:hypothetical protein
VAPKCRFRDEPLEHWTFFLQDPSGNWLEFKHYSDPQAILGRRELSEVGDRDLRGALACADPTRSEQGPGCRS